jgi:hypothetical protein
MRTAILLALCVSVFASATSAGDVYVPDQKYTGRCNVIPMNGPWPSSNPNGEWRYQTHINAAWIGQAGQIKEIAFLPCYSGLSLTSPTFEIRMSHTTLPAPTSNFSANLPNPVVVYPKGPFTWKPTQQVWSDLGLKTPFYYNGADNLTIEIRYQNGKVTGTVACDTNSADPKAPYRTYAYGPGAYSTNTPATTGSRAGLKIRLTFADTTITGAGTTRIGTTVTFTLSSPADGGLPYQVGSSLGTGPIPIDTRKLGLSADPLLVASVGGTLPTVFEAYAGNLDAAGKGQARFHIPNLAPLVGIRIHTAFLTIKIGAPSNIANISGTFSFTILK